MKLTYTREEIEAEHEYATPHIECGVKLHGGFSEDGTYVSPRTRNRWQAIKNWQQHLKDRGAEIVEATGDLLTEPNFPNIAQQVWLLKNGIEQGFWNSLTCRGWRRRRGWWA